MEKLVERGSYYSDEDRRAAVLSYAVHGNVSRVAKLLDIPKSTIRDWLRTDWWQTLTEQVRSEKDAEIVAGMDRIIGLAIAETEERLEHGDAVLHQGEIRRVPVRAKDAAVIGAVAIDKRQLMLNKPTSIRGESASGIEELVQRFEQISRHHDAKVVSDQ